MTAQTFIELVRPYVKNSLFNPLFIPRHATREFLKQAADRTSGLLLEVGCGDKEFSDLLSRRISQYVGLEYPPARGAQGATATHADVWGDGLHLPFTDRAFDTVLCLSVLEHVPDPIGVLKECHRVMKPGAHLLTATPLSERVHLQPYDFYRYTPDGLRHLARSAGLDVCSISSRTGTWATIGSKISMYLLYNVMFTKNEDYSGRKVRLWTLPVGVPLCALIQSLFLAMDFLHRDDHDADQYFMTARRPLTS